MKRIDYNSYLAIFIKDNKVIYEERIMAISDSLANTKAEEFGKEKGLIYTTLYVTNIKG